MSWPPRSTDAQLAADRAVVRKMLERTGRTGLAKPRKRGAQIKRPEQALQITVADYLRIATRAPARWWFVPNGGNLTKVQRGKFKRMGLTPGVSDLHFAWRDQIGGPFSLPRYAVIELKAPGGSADDRSPEQVAFMNDMAACGHRTATCASFEEVVSILTRWGFPLRVTS